jgi:hypothetical protein
MTDMESVMFHYGQASGNHFADMAVACQVRRLFVASD